MALLQLWIPSSFSKQEIRPSLSLFKPPSSPPSSLPLISSSLSFSTSSYPTTTRRSTTLLSFQLPHAIAQQSPSSSSSADNIEDKEEEQGPKTRLIAQNIPWTYTTDDIQTLFEKHGTVIDVEMSMYNKIRNRGLAFITMGSEEEAHTALTQLNSYETEGRVINVEFAKARKKKKRSSTMGIIESPNHDVFVGNLSWKVKSKDLKDFFESMNANAIAAEVVYQANPRKPAGYGFVSFSSREGASAAISAFQGKILMGNSINLKHSKRKAKEESQDGSQSGTKSTEMNGNEEGQTF